MKTGIIKWSAILLFVSTVVSVKAQTADELLQLGTHEIQGTARFTGLGGAFNALGGDFGSLSTNPAGIATYRSSEFVITPSLNLNKTITNFRGQSLSDNRTRFGLTNLGYVGTHLSSKSEGLVSINFGLGYNKAANFYKRTRLRGYDSPNSILDMFTQYANNLKLNQDYLLNNNFQNILPEDWTTAIALATEMIRYDDDDDIYRLNGLDEGDKVDIYGSTLQSGDTEEYVFSVGGNISNRFQFGVTLGWQNLEYINSLSYREEYIGGLEGISDKYISSARDEYIRTVGAGVNVKFGVIYRPINEFRLGFAIHTPTFFNMEREYQVSMVSLYKTAGEEDSRGEDSPSDIYEYTLITPYRMEFGLAYILGKFGLISIDYELVGNSSMRISDNIANDEYTDVRNDAIKNSYRNTSNVRVGAEVSLPRGLMLRAGFNYFQSPYKDSSLDFARYTSSFGFGYRSKHFFADFAYSLNTGKYHFAPYYVNDYRVRNSDVKPDVAVETLKIRRIIATIGFKF
jgi:hypothetical protein